MGNPSNYRVKVDLSQFYTDVRKLSYVYVNEQSISHILHLHERIKEVFGISRSFYLTSCEGVYLPLNEDVRIIQGEEIITVCPGTVAPNHLTIWKEIGVKYNGKPLKRIQVPRELEEKNQQTNPSAEKTPMVIDSDACESISSKCQRKNRCPNGSVIVTESEGQAQTSLPEDSDTDVPPDPSGNNTAKEPSQTPELYSIPQKKRRRVRKRKPKASPEVPENPQPDPQPSKPISIPYISSFIPRTKPKHLKFNWEETNWDEEKDSKMNVRKNGVKPEVNPVIPELNALLSLKNCQFPLTFVGQKKDMKKSDCSSQNEISGVNGEQQSPVKNGNGDLSSNSEREIDFSRINPLDFPIYNQDFDVGDVVAFRVLKMGSDYSPTVSGYIVAETVSRDAETTIYSFKIISGRDQLKNPEGKFSLAIDEEMDNPEETLNDSGIHALSRGELLELRMIHRQGT